MLTNQFSFDVQPTVKTTITAPKTQRNSKPKHILTVKNLRSRLPADVSKRKQQGEASVSENISSVVSHEEDAAEENIFGGTVERRKSNRRNSFTSSLMSRSKVVPTCFPH